MSSKLKPKRSSKGLEKVPTGIEGFDQISYGGIPKGRPTLICGNTGCGKTLMALEIIIRGSLEFNEPGVFLAFEETKEDLIKNVASMGFDLRELENKKLIYIDYIYVDTKGYQETGEYDLEGLFIRLENAVKSIGAKRVGIDTLEVLFGGFDDEALLRSELRRLFYWLKEKNLTTVVTGEQGAGLGLTRHGIEEYVADCVISLNHRMQDDFFTRRLQIVKYRGSYHETNEFPFTIGKTGISLLPITSVELNSKGVEKKVSSGISELDLILDGKGFYQGSSILVSGSSGSGKTTFASAFALSVCKSKQNCLYFSYEESANEIVRNLSSVGIDLKNSLEEGRLKVIATRPTQWGLEKHLGNFIEAVNTFKPAAVIIDPISTLAHCGSDSQIYSLLTRMIDFLKNRNITLFMTMLYFKEKGKEFSYGISSIIDTWILLRNDESNGELNRDLIVIKSRGMQHSNQVREFTIASNGILLKDPYYGESGVLTGTARIVQEHKDQIDEADNLNKLHKLHEQIAFKKRLLEIQIKSLKAEIDFKEREAQEEEKLFHFKEHIHHENREDIQKSRSVNKKSKL